MKKTSDEVVKAGFPSIIASLGISEFVATQDQTAGKAFAALDAFLSSSLYLGLMGIALSAAALFLVIAEQARASAIGLSNKNVGQMIGERGNLNAVQAEITGLDDRSKKISSAANKMFHAFYVALFGLCTTPIFDGILESDLSAESEVKVLSIFQFLGAGFQVPTGFSWPEEVVEAWIGLSATGICMILIVMASNNVLRAIKPTTTEP